MLLRTSCSSLAGGLGFYLLLNSLEISLKSFVNTVVTVAANDVRRQISVKPSNKREVSVQARKVLCLYHSLYGVFAKH